MTDNRRTPPALPNPQADQSPPDAAPSTASDAHTHAPARTGRVPSRRVIVPWANPQSNAPHGIRSQLNRQPPPNYRPPAPGPDGVVRNPAALSEQLSLLATRALRPEGRAVPERSARERIMLIGDRHAIQFEPGTSGRSGLPTIFVRAAPYAESSTRPNSIDWQRSLILSLAPFELGLLLGTLWGSTRRCLLIGHGDKHDVWLGARAMPEGIVQVTVGQGRDLRRADITHREIVPLALMVDRATRGALGTASLPMDALLRQLDRLYAAAQRGRFEVIRDRSSATPDPQPKEGS